MVRPFWTDWSGTSPSIDRPMISEIVLDQFKVLDGLVWTDSPNRNLCSKYLTRFVNILWVARFDVSEP